MKKVGLTSLAAAFFSFSLSSLQPLSENGAIIGGVATGAGAAALTYFFSTAARQRGSGYVVPLAVGSIVGGLAGLGMYSFLHTLTPEGRYAFAYRLVAIVSKSKLATVTFTTPHELCGSAGRSFNKRWPVAEGYEACELYLTNLHSAAQALELATQEAVSSKLLSEIDKLSKKLEALSIVLEQNSALLQTHPKFELQQLALEGYRREQAAEERHKELQRQLTTLQAQQALHDLRT